jgi:hypothetical protein
VRLRSEMREFAGSRKISLYLYVPYSTLSKPRKYHKSQQSQTLFQPAWDDSWDPFTTDEWIRRQCHVR